MERQMISSLEWRDVVSRFLFKVLVIFIVFFMFFPTPIKVYADESTFVTKLGEWLGSEPDEEAIYNWSLAISSLRTDGFSDDAIAGILGNVKVEGGTNAFAIEGYGGKTTTDGKNYTQFEVGNTYDYGEVKPSLYKNAAGKTMGGEGHGLVQWSFERATSLSEFAESGQFDYITVTHWHKSYDTNMSQDTYNVPSMAGQVCFMIEELNGSYSGVKSKIKDSTSAESSAKTFHDEYEKSSSSDTTTRQTEAKNALPVVKACEGIIGEGKASNGKSNSQLLSDALVGGGIWDESKFADFNALSETPLTFPSLDDLSKDQLQGVVDWKNNIEYENDDVFVVVLRRVVMLAGILFLVWVILIYLCYWFDRINNFVDLELLTIITGGRLRISPEEHECTFNPKTFAKGQSQTVNHKAILGICLVGIFVAVLIITGHLYTILNSLIRKMLSLLGVVG